MYSNETLTPSAFLALSVIPWGTLHSSVIFPSVVKWEGSGKFVRWFDNVWHLVLVYVVIMRRNIFSLLCELLFWFRELLFRSFLQFSSGCSFLSYWLMKSSCLLGHTLLHMLKIMFLFLSFHALYKRLNICRSNIKILMLTLWLFPHFKTPFTTGWS